LTTEVFGAAIRAGRGRAYLHVRQFGLSAVADLVLAACLKDQRYDPQFEESRASWLFSMFDGAKEYPSFSSSSVNALERETNTWDSQQLCELAALMAKNGDAKAHEALRARAFRQAETAGSDDDWVGADSLLSVDGLSAVPDLVRRYGRSLSTHGHKFGDVFIGRTSPGLPGQPEAPRRTPASHGYPASPSPARRAASERTDPG